jgi:hypothetical protein
MFDGWNTQSRIGRSICAVKVFYRCFFRLVTVGESTWMGRRTNPLPTSTLRTAPLDVEALRPRVTYSSKAIMSLLTANRICSSNQSNTRYEAVGSKVTAFVRFEIFTAVTMKNGVFWDVMPCGSCKNRRFGGTYRLHHRSENNQRARNNVSSN